MKRSPRRLFALRLARRNGWINVDAMLRTITAKQFRELEWFEEIEPPESTRDDFRASSIATMIANVNRGKDQAAYSINDFLVRFVDPEQAAEEEAARYSQRRLEHIMYLRALTMTNNAQPNLPEC